MQGTGDLQRIMSVALSANLAQKERVDGMRFFIGLHHPSVAWPFRQVMISVNTLAQRKSDFRVNDWILDSGAFSQISRHGRFVISPEAYLRAIQRWNKCGNLICAVTQDWMCEDFILERTGLSVEEHQDRTIQSYLYLRERAPVYVMPVLQGFTPDDYVRHLHGYNMFLDPGTWIGVGSVCKRNGNLDAIEDVLLAIKSKRPDLRLHGFGLKVQALESGTVRSLLYSSDSMAWSFADLYEGGNGHDPRVALRYAAKVEAIIGEPCFVQDQLFKWWTPS
jgi:hypothetical protein